MKTCEHSKLILVMLVALSGIVLYYTTGPNDRPIVLPLLVLVFVTYIFYLIHWSRSRILPLFDVGSFCVASIFVYSIIPLTGFWASGLAFSTFADTRLLKYLPTSSELGNYAWNHVVYLASFVIGYLMIIKKGVLRTDIDAGEKVDIKILLSVMAGIYIYIGFLHMSGLEQFRMSYRDMFDNADQISQLPLLIKQINQVLNGTLFIMKLAVLLYLFKNRGRLPNALKIVSLWIIIETLITVISFGARTELVLLLVASILLYHRYVKPWSVKYLALFSVVLLTAFITYGLLRDIGDVSDEITGKEQLLSQNEFQAVFNTGYDVYRMVSDGEVTQIPWQLYLSDVLMLIPQQLLPFEKIDPAQWYLEQIGYKDSKMGFMFGVIAQGALGFGMVELALRGFLLAVLLALIHNWYLKKSNGFLPTLFYIWLCLSVYYTMRASSFYILTWFIQRFVPVYMLLRYSPHILNLVWTSPASLPVSAGQKRRG